MASAFIIKALYPFSSTDNKAPHHCPYLKGMVKNLVEHDSYGIIYDDPFYMTMSVENSCPGNSDIIAAFKQHMKENYSFDYLAFFQIQKMVFLNNPAPLTSNFHSSAPPFSFLFQYFLFAPLSPFALFLSHAKIPNIRQ